MPKITTKYLWAVSYMLTRQSFAWAHPVHKSSRSACKPFLLCQGLSYFPLLPENPEQKKMPSRKQRASVGGVISQRELGRCPKQQVGSFCLEDDRIQTVISLKIKLSALETKSQRCLGLSRCCSAGYSSGMTSSAGIDLCDHSDTLQCSRALWKA